MRLYVIMTSINMDAPSYYNAPKTVHDIGTRLSDVHLDGMHLTCMHLGTIPPKTL
jgi:hypothetical protein